MPEQNESTLVFFNQHLGVQMSANKCDSKIFIYSIYLLFIAEHFFKLSQNHMKNLVYVV